MCRIMFTAKATLTHTEEDGDSIFVGASIFKRISPCLVLFAEAAAQRRGMRPLSLFWCFNIKKSSKVKSKKYTRNIGQREKYWDS